MFEAFFAKGPISMASIDLGNEKVRIPVADMRSKTPGKTLLVTAGLDGDEYAGIQAAYALIKHYAEKEFAGRLIVLPIVNMPGFLAETSKNPLDGKFPKYIFPGSADGTATERLMHAVAQYAYDADLWLDLHSGAITETTRPLLWTYTTGNTSIDECTRAFYSTSQASTVIQEPTFRGGMAEVLKKHDTAYVLAESGGRGEQTQTDIDRHYLWAEAAMQSLGMIAHAPASFADQTVYTHVEYVSAPHDGIFHAGPAQPHVKKGDVLGTYGTFDALATRELLAPIEGIVLYRKETMAMRKDDTLVAIASKQ